MFDEPNPIFSFRIPSKYIRAFVTKEGTFTSCLMGVSVFQSQPKPPQPPASDDGDDVKPDAIIEPEM